MATSGRLASNDSLGSNPDLSPPASVDENGESNKAESDDDVDQLVTAAVSRLRIDDDTDQVDSSGANTELGGPLIPAASAPPTEPVKSPNKRTLNHMASLIRGDTIQATKIVVLTGAGISVAAGIPDFRTPGTGLYDNLQKYRLPYPEAVFDIQYFARRPQAFVRLAKEIWPGQHQEQAWRQRGPKNTKLKHPPTLTHCFLAMLASRQQLLRVYTQNIDGLDHLAGVPEDRLIECHGHFRSASCIRCSYSVADATAMKDIQQHYVEADEKTSTPPQCPSCRKGFIKPDIVFFGEGLPARFHSSLPADLQQADLLLVLGTSLQVAPVCTIPDRVQASATRVLVNRERVGHWELDGDDQESVEEQRDWFYQGDCDAAILELARLLGWEEDLRKHHKRVASV
jgi:NAD-dependent SIR2 family protein deacetylase